MFSYLCVDPRILHDPAKQDHIVPHSACSTAIADERTDWRMVTQATCNRPSADLIPLIPLTSLFNHFTSTALY